MLIGVFSCVFSPPHNEPITAGQTNSDWFDGQRGHAVRPMGVNLYSDVELGRNEARGLFVFRIYETNPASVEV